MSDCHVDGFAGDARKCRQCKRFINDKYSYLYDRGLYHKGCMSGHHLGGPSARRVEMESFLAGTKRERDIWIDELQSKKPNEGLDEWVDELWVTAQVFG